MRRRGLLSLGASLMAFGLLSAPVVRPVALAVAAPLGGVVTDEVDDLTQDGDSDLPPAQEADVIAASGEYTAEGIVLTVKAKKPTDPAADRNWRSEDTYISWYLETTGDKREDYEATYFFESGKLGGEVLPVDDNVDDPKPLCDLVSATYDAEAGYRAVVPAKCIGDPKAVSWSLQFNYQSDPRDDTSLSWDNVPESGFAGPLTLGGAIAPMSESPTSTTAPASPTGSAGPTPTGPSATTPTSAPAAGRAPGAGKAPTTATTRRPASGSPTTARSAADPAIDAASVPPLAHTGLADRTLRVAAFAVGIALIGIGLLFANRRTALR